MDREKAKTDLDGEAVYFSALALLDELPDHESRRLVLLNWVKYVMLTEAGTGIEITAKNHGEILARFAALCSLFALHVVGMPDLVPEWMPDMDPCGECEQCMKDARQNASSN